jgi:nucleotide-binding universal stress UspA family protein
MFVVGYDGSDGAERALDTAIDLGRRLGEPLVVAFAAQPPGRSVGAEYRSHLDGREPASRRRARLDAAQAPAPQHSAGAGGPGLARDHVLDRAECAGGAAQARVEHDQAAREQ